ncbi:MAG: ABC-F family ATP-binding cassette domain-containing protein [Flavobacteriales bacterium]
MNYLSVENISKAFDERVLFEGVSFGLSKGDRVALVAKNGAGKSTIFKMLMGEILHDDGNIVFREGIKMGWLEQEPKFISGQTIQEYIYDSKNPKILLIQKYQKMLDEGVSDNATMQKVLDEIDKTHAWDTEAKIQEVLTSLNLNTPNQVTTNMSGGEKRRLALAKVLIEEPEFLLLDEPTNHLDLEMVEWLEKYMTRPEITMLVITHDRYFLDSVCNRIIELDQGTLYEYEGNYEYFLSKREERIHNAKTVAAKAKNLLKKEVEWLGKMPKARTTKAKYRIDAVDEIREKAFSFKEERKISIESHVSRIGKKVLELHNVSKSYGDREIIKKFSYVFKKEEKVGIIGRNGSGKSTLLNMIKSLEEPTSGRIEVGHTVKIGYYSQKLESAKPGQRVIDSLRDYADEVKMSGGRTMSISQLLVKFQFDLKKQTAYVESLSGGERKRLQLVSILIQNPNFLILDEPTNDLDLNTLAALEEFLADFEGCVIVVSHDRYFLDNVVDHLFVFRGNGEIQDFPGNYSQFREQKSMKAALAVEELKSDKEKAKKEEPEVPKEKKKLTYKERQEYEQLEKEIGELEKKQLSISEEFSSGKLSGDEFNQRSVELAKISTTLEEKTLRWMELAEYA